MLPGFSVSNLQYPSAGDTELTTEITEVLVAGADCSYVVVSEDAFVMPHTKLVASLSYCISYVVGVRANEEMLWIYTVRVIAGVANDTFWIDFSVLHLESETVSIPLVVICMDYLVADAN